jgi:hypothetical protein
VFIATVCRYIGEIRAALFGLPWKNQTDLVGNRAARNAQIVADFDSWLKNGGGYMQDGVDAMDAEFREALTLIGSSYG